MFIEILFKVVNSDQLLLSLSIFCLLLSTIFYPVKNAKNNLQKFVLLPLIAGFLFEGVCILIAFFSNTIIIPENFFPVNIILSLLGFWEYYRLNIKKETIP
jgi:hypothetical protein